jgi:hypothetical protein
MIEALVKGTLAGGAAFFMWGVVSWMALPWHNAVLEKLSDEPRVLEALETAAPRSGVYLYPNESREGMTPEQQGAASEKMARGPFLFVSVRRAGMSGMAGPMMASFFISALGSLLLTLLLLQVRGLAFFGRVIYVMLVMLTAGVFAHLPSWNWFGFSTGYTLVAVMDLVLSGVAGGFAIAWATQRT